MNWYIKKAQAFRSSQGIFHVHRENWITIDVDPELSRYYLSLFNRSRPMLEGQIMPGAWKGHISVVRGEDIKNSEILSDINGKSVNFQYDHNIHWNGRHAYLSVECEEALDLREQLGLNREPPLPLHLTVGVKKEL